MKLVALQSEISATLREEYEEDIQNLKLCYLDILK